MPKDTQTKTKKDFKFTQISNQILKNPEISFKAKGIYCAMKSYPPTWNFTVHSICKMGKEGRDSVKNGLDELKRYGYIYMQRYRKDGKWKIQYWIFDKPEDNPFYAGLDAEEEKERLKKCKDQQKELAKFHSLDDFDDDEEWELGKC